MPAAATSSPNRTASRPSATRPASRSARRSGAAPRRTAPRSRTCATSPRGPGSGSTRSTPSWRRPRPSSRTCCSGSPTPPIPTSRSAARRPTSPSAPGASPDAHEGTTPDGATWTRRPHWEIGEALDIIDNPRGAKIAGSGFPVYKGLGSAPAAGLISWFLDVHTREHGFTEIWPPCGGQHRVRPRHGPDPGQGRPDVRRHPRRPVPGPHGRGPGHQPPPRRDPRGGRAADPLRGLLALLPARGRRRRQGHPRDPARPPVRQGRDGHVREARGQRRGPRVDDRPRRDPAPAAGPRRTASCS